MYPPCPSFLFRWRSPPLILCRQTVQRSFLREGSGIWGPAGPIGREAVLDVELVVESIVGGMGTPIDSCVCVCCCCSSVFVSCSGAAAVGAAVRGGEEEGKREGWESPIDVTQIKDMREGERSVFVLFEYV